MHLGVEKKLFKCINSAGVTVWVVAAAPKFTLRDSGCISIFILNVNNFQLLLLAVWIKSIPDMIFDRIC